jgi:hypothetical protein
MLAAGKFSPEKLYHTEDASKGARLARQSARDLLDELCRMLEFRSAPALRRLEIASALPWTRHMP